MAGPQNWKPFGTAQKGARRSKQGFNSRYDERYDNWDWLMELGQKMIDEGMEPRDIQAISQGLAQLATVITGLVLENRGRTRNKKFYDDDAASVEGGE